MQVRYPQIREHLSEVDRVEPLRTLDLDHHAIPNDDVWPVLRQQLPFVMERESRLSGEGQTALLEFKAQGRFICVFEQAWTQVPVYFDGTANHALANRVVDGISGQHESSESQCLRGPVKWWGRFRRTASAQRRAWMSE